MKRFISLQILVIICVTSSVQAQDSNTFFEKTNSFLAQHVRDGKVAYKVIKEDPVALEELLDIAEELEIPVEESKRYQAFWINVYNLLVIKSVTENYPLKSPLDVPGFFDKNIHQVGGISTTLNDIENIRLRKQFPNEPRFHFALVCAGLGCPPIIDRAYLPDSLDDQLETQTFEALNNPQFIRPGKKKLAISQIFEWYEEDFNRNGQNTLRFINSYSKDKYPEDSKLSYYPYDWNLNELK